MDTQQLLGEVAGQLLSGTIQVVDLTAPLGPNTPLIKLPPELAVDTPKVEIHAISHYDKNGPWWAWNWLKLGEHSGTHFDAPQHWITGKDYPDGATDTIPVQNFVGPVNVIDCSKQAAADNDFLLTVDHIKAWEAEHGAINAGEWVVMRTDWYKRNGSEAEFLNADETGPHTPGPTAEAIQYLISKDIRGWGSETIGTDAGKAGGMEPPFPAHSLMHKANRYGLASLCNLDRLPPKGAILIAAPLKIEHGTGSPIRALVLVPRA
ncbi:MAG: cyclase family protein [Mesorhizobium sp.]|uniref:cyclase family protein n=1 Tax=unclassified Mesorhizobium TaxID=325217 RepID=UPI000FE4C528|nr:MULTISPECIES: cyclase family protein [unclassified Mesorhizobium]RWC11963.1 MAG: cyclase family protein [Mesorhizobium sp.]TGT98580.1 cyclase family protein [Mesorhizobium sp. M5C.F.Ca.ET.164.01.1.1]TIU21649.1 MAG: cyclase family protein [Mesorhizobium sp.]